MGDNEQWVTVSEAVGIYGKSERTVRRWVREGKLQSKTERNKLYVLAPDFAPDLRQAKKGAPDIQELQVKIEKLEMDVEAKAAIIEQLTGERDFLRQAHAASLSQIQILIEAETEKKSGKKWWRFWGD